MAHNKLIDPCLGCSAPCREHHICLYLSSQGDGEGLERSTGRCEAGLLISRSEAVRAPRSRSPASLITAAPTPPSVKRAVLSLWAPAVAICAPMRAFLLTALAASASGLAEELSGKSFEKRVFGGKKAVFVKFLAP